MSAGHLDPLTLAAVTGLLASVGALFWLAGDEDVREALASEWGDWPAVPKGMQFGGRQKSGGGAGARPTADAQGEIAPHGEHL